MAVEPSRRAAFMSAFVCRSGSLVDPVTAGIEALDAYDYEQAAQGHDVIGWFPESDQLDITRSDDGRLGE